MCGNAYVADGNVLFSVPSMPDYGRLSKRPLDEMIAGARVEVAPCTERDATDFRAVEAFKAWRAGVAVALRHRDAPAGLAGDIQLPVMRKHLGETFDIHGGGIDLRVSAPRE